jgi:pimeloyl-ACP methyl ester carboxylesterase
VSATVVLVHGAWHGAWCWDLVRRRLDAAGIANIAVDLPSVQRAGATLTDDADHVRSVLDATPAPVVLVGHSYGGAVITDAGTHPNVAHLVYLTAFALDEGESVNENDLTGGETMTLADAIDASDGVLRFDPELAREYFFHDCDLGTSASAAGQLRPMSFGAMTGSPRAIAWRDRPSTYVVCTDDRALPVALQESNARRTGTVVEMPTSHSPFLSRPDLVADLLARIVAGCDR